ncbi:MAG: hypothetical protein KC419_00340 [Anaerolineales bacterium]|nr:hypothetical protein [Anaerolineales bacterium]MCA9926882.1 hypothetical protein [Anaerolineales bacterium]
MKRKKVNHRIILAALPLILLPLLFAVFSPQATTAALPPRPTVEPAKAKLPGALIQLQIEGAALGSEGVWTVVQWVDTFGVWHNVDGWQGTVELDGTQTWWFAEEYLGAGPFRWQVFSTEGGDLLETSDEFNLPDMSGYMLIVPVVIE